VQYVSPKGTLQYVPLPFIAAIICSDSQLTNTLPGFFSLLHTRDISRAVESESEGILGGVAVSKNVPTPTSI
jgi:hypothetical protein